LKSESVALTRGSNSLKPKEATGDRRYEEATGDRRYIALFRHCLAGYGGQDRGRAIWNIQ
jgi:hypothetical protein